jgi:SSS family solute:Na+ symporter
VAVFYFRRECNDQGSGVDALFPDRSGTGIHGAQPPEGKPQPVFSGRPSLSTFVLLATMAATNFSAFTVFGASGAGYRDGLAFFPIMAFAPALWP